MKNQSCSVKLITSLLSPCHNHASSNKTVTGNGGGRIISEMSLFWIWVSIHHALALFVTGLSLSLFAWSPKKIHIHVLFLAYDEKKKKCLCCLPFLFLMQIIYLLWRFSQINEKHKQIGVGKKRGVCWLIVYTAMIMLLFSALQCCDIYWKRLSCFISVDCWIKLIAVSQSPPSALPHLLSYWAAILLMTSGG